MIATRLAALQGDQACRSISPRRPADPQEGIRKPEVDEHADEVHDRGDHRCRQRGRIRPDAACGEGQQRADDAAQRRAHQHARAHHQQHVHAYAFAEIGQDRFQDGDGDAQSRRHRQLAFDHEPDIAPAQLEFAQGHAADHQRGRLAAGVAAHVHDRRDEGRQHDHLRQQLFLGGHECTGDDAETGQDRQPEHTHPEHLLQRRAAYIQIVAVPAHRAAETRQL
ncbi:hypothetical protein QT383_19515 [Stenotrophomonas rhizophila]